MKRNLSGGSGKTTPQLLSRLRGDSSAHTADGGQIHLDRIWPNLTKHRAVLFPATIYLTVLGPDRLVFSHRSRSCYEKISADGTVHLDLQGNVELTVDDPTFGGGQRSRKHALGLECADPEHSRDRHRQCADAIPRP